MEDEKKIILYTGEGCPPCQQTKDYLKSRGIEYKEIDLTKEENIELAKKIIDEIGGIAIPIIKTRDKYIVGFNKKEIDELITDTD